MIVNLPSFLCYDVEKETNNTEQLCYFFLTVADTVCEQIDLDAIISQRLMVSYYLKLHFSLSLFLLIVFPVSLTSFFPVISFSLVVFLLFLEKTSVYLIKCVHGPSEKCAQTLVLGVMLSVLMEV